MRGEGRDERDVGVVSCPGESEGGLSRVELGGDGGELADLFDLGESGGRLEGRNGTLEEGGVGGESRVLGDLGEVSVSVDVWDEGGGLRLTPSLYFPVRRPLSRGLQMVVPYCD